MADAPTQESPAPAARTLLEVARWLFLVALVFAPWAYGSTPQWAVIALEAMMGGIVALWVAGSLLRGIPPAVPPVLLGGSLLILAYGYWMALNAHMRVTPDDYFVPVHAPVPWAPGSVDSVSSWRMLLRAACLLGTACFVCDVAGRRVWRRRIWNAMAGTGVLLVLFGLIQSAFAKPLLNWDVRDATTPYFATYYYHGNAGSLINMVLPLVAGLAMLTLRNPDAHLRRTFWFPGVFICVAGAFVNVSRSATAVTVVLCVLLVVWQFRSGTGNELLPRRRLRWVYATLMVAGVACLVAFSGWERPVEKWGKMHSQLNARNKRLVSTEICLRMLPDAGWHGFGPGTFALVFPHYTGEKASLIPGIWRYAHDDYLQTLLEWGWVGAIPFGVLFFGAVVQLFKASMRAYGLSTSDRVLAYTCGLALTGAALHAFVDFPFQIASLQLYASVFAGFGWGCRKWEKVIHPS